MAALSILLGNAFAAFPLMTAAVAIPILVQRFHANPIPVASIGMLCGYCGTLLSPMAANFNLVPVALLDLPDRHAVIRAQLPTAVLLLLVNIALMGWLSLPANPPMPAPAGHAAQGNFLGWAGLFQGEVFP
jgi:uncharacterized membrane protein